MAGAVQLFTADSAIAQQNASCNFESDFVTGGGFIVFENGKHGNFGVAGGCKNGSFFGHLEYVDHGSGLVPSLPTPFTVHGTSITGYLMEGPDGTDLKDRRTGTRLICGTARTNLQPPDDNVDFRVRVRDAGEPGDMDEFDILLTKSGTVTPVYSTFTSSPFVPHKLNGGNIQLHGPTTGDFGGCVTPA